MIIDIKNEHILMFVFCFLDSYYILTIFLIKKIFFIIYKWYFYKNIISFLTNLNILSLCCLTLYTRL